VTRPLRSTFGYGIWHLASRGVDGRPIFMDDDDRLLFLELLSRVIDRYGWRCHAYCLMGNHFHLVIECGQPELSDGMERLNGLYAAAFNHRYRRAGHLFQRRFLIEGDRGRELPRRSVRLRVGEPGASRTLCAPQRLAVGRPRPPSPPRPALSESGAGAASSTPRTRSRAPSRLLRSAG
jgi:REP element-mobilizing transposase RayT